ncbi:MAG: Mur ligase family protein [Bacteroidales bacterium]|jgi:UDP-N-acetylmuramate: L-alanyl-gamma-D-glutamyl-meso-diaminopimelate ligase
MTRVHFIAVGGAVMHNLAIALHKKGYIVTGSDDEIFEPSRGRLKEYGLLPSSMGWEASRISEDIDTVILGMHAKEDNPELKRAKELGIKIMSFPEYLYDQTKDKRRIVVAGSHGKTTTTAMIMHVLRTSGVSFSYMVGSSIDGFETMVGLSDESKIAVFEGDEYLTSPLDRRPKFHLYKPDIAVITGIAWDHMNVFPTFENYLGQFRIFIDTIAENGSLIFFGDDREAAGLSSEARSDIRRIPYKTHGYFQNKTGFYAATHDRVVPMRIFGEHNMQNLSAAREACHLAGVTDEQFYDSIRTFEGTSRRLQKLLETEIGIVYLDFAHAPSKVRATINAVAERYPQREIIACLELHTYSSLNADFLPQYSGTMESATYSFVYFNPHAVAMKKLSLLSKEHVEKLFGGKNLKAFDISTDMFNNIKGLRVKDPVYLLMSSGDFDGTDMLKLAGELLSNK